MTIPKIIHQLWIGDKPAPFNLMNSVKDMNPDFEYVFWNEEKLKELTITKKYSQKITLMEELNGKADMYRWIILEKYGGVFVDADMISIEPIDDFLLNTPFFCFENEMVRPGLCATTIMGFTKEHIIPKLSIDWIMNNRITSPAWISVGPQLLTNIYNSIRSTGTAGVVIYPSYYFLPDHHTGKKYNGHGKVYMCHEWGSTRNNYDQMNNMEIPSHHKKPKQSIDITINPTSTKNELKEIMNGCKNMIGNFKINIIYDGELDILKYLKSSRFIFLKL
mgnify:CR=1 FL=1